MKRVITATGLALAMASTAACGGGHTSSPTTVTVTAAPPAQTTAVPIATPTPVAQPPAELGQWVTDDSISFNVCESFTDLPGYTTDRGDDLWLIIWIKNVGNRPRTYSKRLQRLTDDQGRVFAPYLGLSTFDWPAGDNRSEVDLNPGVTAKVRLDFIVPKDAVGDWRVHQQLGFRAELHGSSGSPGAVVQLREDSLPNCT